MMLVLKTHLGFLHRIFSNEILAESMLRFLNSLLVFVSSCMRYVFGLIVPYTLRYKGCGSSESEQIVDGGRNCEVNANLGSKLATSTSKYQFISGKDIVGFIERPENVCFSVQECCFVNSDDLDFCNSNLCDMRVLAEKDVETKTFEPEEVVETSSYLSFKDGLGKIEDVLELEDNVFESRDCSDQCESESVGSSYEFLRCDREVDFIEYEFLPGKHFGAELESEGSVVADEKKVTVTEGIEMGKDFCMNERGVSEVNEAFFIVKNDDFNEEYVELDQYLETPIGLDAEKLPVNHNCEADLIHQDATMIGNSSEAKENLLVYDDNYEEHVGLDTELQKSIGSEAEEFDADGICQDDSVHQEAEVIETLDKATDPNLQEKLSVDIGYDDQFVTFDQHLLDTIELDAEKLTGDYICKVDLDHQKSEDLRTLHEAKEPSLMGKLPYIYNSNEGLPRVHQHLQMSIPLDVEKFGNATICEGELVHPEAAVIETFDEAVEPCSSRNLSSCYNSNEELQRVNQHLQKSIQIDAEKFGTASVCEDESLHPEAKVIGTFNETMEPSFHSNTSFYDEDDSDDMDQDHDDLVHQLKEELKRVRTGGLPTILEESESPKVEADYLRPLKIDVKIEHKDRMEEIQKVYKSYADKMRKLDILNYQALNAISLHQKKDSNCLNSSKKSFRLALQSFLPQKLSPSKARRVAADPTLKCIENLHKDIEMVYVGQVCLSWEILCWEYRKARELQENDSQGFRQYNGVANEFQLFQVLIQRFLEDEPFQGHRITNYVNYRCNLRNILQVPAIRDDSLKGQRFHKGMELTDAVSIMELIGIIEASMQVFWEFICADKDSDINSKSSRHSLAELQDTANSVLLHNIRIDLQKKDKKLREILRSGNCIIKRFQKSRGGHQLHRALFFAQVELKIISRVINMSKLTTNQLLWCREKLGRVDLARDRIHVESMFSLFPC